MGEANLRAKKAAKKRGNKRRFVPEDADGRLRPQFLAAFPGDPALDRLVRAFEAGNFQLVRQLGPKLVRETPSPEVKRAASELLERIKPDPLLKYILVLSFLLLAYLSAHAYLH